MLGQTKRLRILDDSTTNRTAGRPSASRKGVCHDGIGRAQGGQVVFLQDRSANCSRPIQHALAPMVLAFLLAPHRRCLKTIAGEVLAASLSCGHDLSAADQSPMADAGLVRGPVRRTLGRSERLGAATGERKAAAMDRGHRHDLPFHDVGADGELDRHVEAAAILRGRTLASTPF